VICRARKVGSAKDGQKIDLLTLLRPLTAGEVLDVTLYYHSEKKISSPLKPLRICAVRKSKEQTERAKRKTLRQIHKNPHKRPPNQTTLEMSGYFVLGDFSQRRILSSRTDSGTLPAQMAG